MAYSLEELMTKFGVTYNLSPYQTCPWSIYDEDKDITCSAEVRMEPTGKHVEAEIQLLYTDPPEGKSALDQVLLVKCSLRSGKWQLDDAIIRGDNSFSKTPRWADKICNFFRICVQDIGIGEFPDIEKYMKRELKREKEGDRSGGGSSKSPDIQMQNVLATPKGGSF